MIQKEHTSVGHYLEFMVARYALLYPQLLGFLYTPKMSEFVSTSSWEITSVIIMYLAF